MSLPTTTKIVSSKFTLFAIITISGKSSGNGTDKQVRIPITGIQMRFGANLMNLPMARINVAVGNVMNDGSNKASAIHNVINQLDNYTTIAVYFSAIGEREPGIPWPEGAHLIWYGDIAGTGYTQSPVEFTYAIDSVHWTKKLDRGSLLTKDFTRSNYTDLFAAVACEFSEGVQQVNLPGLAQVVNNASKQSAPADTDLWYQKIFPLLAALMVPLEVSSKSSLQPNQSIYYQTIQNIIATSSINQSTVASKDFIKQFGTSADGTGNHLGNTDALQVLTGVVDPKSVATTIIDGQYKPQTFTHAAISEKSEVNTTIKTFFNNASETPIKDLLVTRPLILDTNSVQVEESINMAVTSHFAGSIGQFTALDKLNSCSELFTFALLPNARTVAIVPTIELFPASRIWRTLKPRDYSLIRGPTSFANVLSGVVIKKANPPEFSAENSTTPPPDLGTLLAGVFIGSRVGQLQLMDSPPWLQWKSLGESSTGAIPSAPSSSYDKNQGVTSKAIENEFLVSGNKYAQTVWAKNNFGYRQMSVSTPLRFDIGPGSNLAIAGINLGPTLRTSAAPQKSTLYGYVQSVMINIDAVNHVADTQLDLSHLRSTVEAGLIPDSHPMYTTGNLWYGQPLVRLSASDMEPEATLI